MGEIYWFVWLLTAVVEAANKVERPGNHIVVGCYEVSLMVISVDYELYVIFWVN